MATIHGETTQLMRACREECGASENSTMGAHEYLEKYIRSVPGGAIAWERSIFSHSGTWNASELIDAAVDLAWDMFTPEKSGERPPLDIHRAGNYFVISPAEQAEAELIRLVAQEAA